MHILLVHNYYQQPGGEDDVFQAECDLLRSHGHEVGTFTRHNDAIRSYGILHKLNMARETVWSSETYRELLARLRTDRPDVVHFHNTFPLVSASAYDACREAGIPVVQSLHNFRFLEPCATLCRDGKVCESCVGETVPWSSLVHGCYHGSRAETAVLAAASAYHKMRGTWQTAVDRYVVFTDFFRRWFVKAGLPTEKVFVKPHFLTPDPGVGSGSGGYALFVGRLSPEKGVETVIRAWRSLRIPLIIRGEGPLESQVEALASENSHITRIARPSRQDYFRLIQGARFLIWPSQCYETFGRVALDAFACAVPVLSCDLGPQAEFVHSGVTGLSFRTGDAEHLAAQATWAWEHSAELAQMGRNGRAEYQRLYTAERNYELMMQLYGGLTHSDTLATGA